jgi:alkylhydroperoxidase family enzyme
MKRWVGTKRYAPHSWLTMLRKPQVFLAYRNLHTAVMMEGGEVPQALKFMIAEAVSTATGDRYCAVHSAQNAHEIGKAPIEKVRALREFRTSPRFSEAERAALELAAAAGAHPPTVSDAHFSELLKHYSEDAITEMVAVISLLGWLNRWNQTLATELEPDARAFVREHLSSPDSP